MNENAKDLLDFITHVDPIDVGWMRTSRNRLVIWNSNNPMHLDGFKSGQSKMTERQALDIAISLVKEKITYYSDSSYSSIKNDYIEIKDILSDIRNSYIKRRKR